MTFLGASGAGGAMPTARDTHEVKDTFDHLAPFPASSPQIVLCSSPFQFCALEESGSGLPCPVMQ